MAGTADSRKEIGLTIEVIGGTLPQKQRRLVEAWAEIHQSELLEDWARLQAGRPPVKIEPLK